MAAIGLHYSQKITCFGVRIDNTVPGRLDNAKVPEVGLFARSGRLGVQE